MIKKKTAPNDARIIVWKDGKKTVYEPGDRSEDYFWWYFELYVEHLVKKIVPRFKVEPQKSFGKDIKVDLFVTGRSKKVLIEVKHYTVSYLSKKDIDKIIRDRDASNPDETWLIVSHTTPKISSKIVLRLSKEKIRFLRAGYDWEKKLAKAFDIEYKDEKPGQQKENLDVEWIFLPN